MHFRGQGPSLPPRSACVLACPCFWFCTFGIHYKHAPLGREAAYGMLAHIKSDEARHALIELCWQAKRKRTAFLGRDSDYRLDPRQVPAEELVQAGHRVEHVHPSGATDPHVACNGDYPDWLKTEEERLRKLEKMRKAGEFKKVEKSKIDRSTEAGPAPFSDEIGRKRCAAEASFSSVPSPAPPAVSSSSTARRWARWRWCARRSS